MVLPKFLKFETIVFEVKVAIAYGLCVLFRTKDGFKNAVYEFV